MHISNELREELLDPDNIEAAWDRGGFIVYTSTFDVRERLLTELIRVVEAKPPKQTGLTEWRAAEREY